MLHGKTPKNKATPGFNAHNPTAHSRGRDSSVSPGVGNQDGLISPAINNFNNQNTNGTASPDLEHLAGTAAFGGGNLEQ